MIPKITADQEAILQASAASLHRRGRITELFDQAKDQLTKQQQHVAELEQWLPEARENLFALEHNVRVYERVLSEFEA